jgi:hypothetical protein
MDPVTAWANAFTAALEFATKAIEGQTPEQKAQVWAWVIDFDKRLRHLLHLPELPTP